MTILRRIWAVPLAVGFASVLLLVACDGDDTPEGDGTPSARSSPTPEAPAASLPADDEIPPAPGDEPSGEPPNALTAQTVARSAPALEAAAVTDYLSRSTLACPFLVEGFYFGLPIVGQGLASRYYYRLDGGAWYRTNWYYTKDISAWYFDEDTGRWVAVPANNSIVTPPAGPGQLVEGWEWQYDFSTRASKWVNLGSCRIFKMGGVIITN